MQGSCFWLLVDLIKIRYYTKLSKTRQKKKKKLKIRLKQNPRFLEKAPRSPHWQCWHTLPQTSVQTYKIFILAHLPRCI